MSEYYKVTYVDDNTSVLVEVDGYQIQDGWVEFYTGQKDFIVLAIPPHGNSFMELTKDVYEKLLLTIEESDEEDEDVERHWQNLIDQGGQNE